ITPLRSPAYCDAAEICLMSRIPHSPGMLISIVWGLLCLSGAVQSAPPESDSAEFFEKEVRPLLAERCFKCHGGEKTKAGLRLTSRATILSGGDSGPAAVPGKPEESLLIQAVRQQNALKMPPNAK